MKHFTTEECIDFVNQVASSSKKREMGGHLEKGCKRCQEAVSLWQRVRATAESVGKYEAPESAVRLAKAAFAGANLGGSRAKWASAIQVLFDSFLQPALAGARAAGDSRTRQMLYRAEPYQIDLHVEDKPGANRIVVMGQLLDTRNPDKPGRAVPVMISNLRGDVVNTVTNEFGEFREEITASSDLELKITGEDEKAVIISLKDALGRTPGCIN
jgi:hypothetical protein